MVKNMQGNPRPGEIYRHFKNQYYQVIAVAHHSESKEKLVIYQALYGDFSVYARPYSMFISEVDSWKYPDVTQKYRFECIGTVGEIKALEEENIQKTVNEKKAGKLQSPEKIGGIEQSEETKQIQETKQMEEAGKGGSCEEQEEAHSQQENANEKLIEFLDAQSYREKRNVLVSMKKELSDDLINAMAASMDIIVEDGPIDRRYRSLLNCIETNMKFETNRFR